MIPAFFQDVPRELIDRFEEVGPAAIGFPPAVNGSRLGPDQYAESLRALGERQGEPLALYIHIPFCPVRCLYCACHTTITHDAAKIDRYLDTLEREMAMVAARLGGGRDLYQLHLGGGTPNYLSDSQLVRLVDMVGRHFRIRPDAATSIECNPRRSSAGQLELLKSLGIKHLSFGVEDLDSTVQHAIGRINSLSMVRDVYATARDTGFDTICLDLVYGLPSQTQRSFNETLNHMLDIAPDRVRCYSYSHRPAVRPHQYAIDPADIPGPALRLALLHDAVGAFTDAGYNWIGVDCFARHDDELCLAQATKRLRHNCIGYTSAPTKHVVALGMSALGEVGGAFVQNEPDLKRWSAAVESDRLPIAWGHKMSTGDLRRREALQHLMCNLELPATLAHGLEHEYARLSSCSQHGLVEVTPSSLRVTPRGRYFLRSLCTQHEVSVAWSSNQWAVPQLI